MQAADPAKHHLLPTAAELEFAASQGHAPFCITDSFCSMHYRQLLLYAHATDPRGCKHHYVGLPTSPVASELSMTGYNLATFTACVHNTELNSLDSMQQGSKTELTLEMEMCSRQITDMELHPHYMLHKLYAEATCAAELFLEYYSNRRHKGLLSPC